MFVDSYRPNWLRITDEKGTVFMEQCLFHLRLLSDIGKNT